VTWQRRAVLVLAAAWSVPALAQSRPIRIGYLVHSPLVEPPSRERVAFLDELRKLGYLVGRNLLIEYRSAENQAESFPQRVDELLKLDVDLILATGDAATLAAKAATNRIPIVFAQSPDPAGNGLVRSLARPGANVTGLYAMAPDLAGKRMQLLREALPSARRVAMIWGAESKLVMNDVKASTQAAARLGMRIEPYAIGDADQVNRQFERIAKTRPDVLFVLADTRMTAYRDIVLDRFGNPAIRDGNQRVAMDGFSKIPGFVAPTVRERLARGESIASVAMLPALFLAFLQRWHRGAIPYAYQDQGMDEAVAHAICDAADPTAAFAGNAGLWGPLAGDARLVVALRHAGARVAAFIQEHHA